MNLNDLLPFIQSRRTCYQFLEKTESPVHLTSIKACLKAAIYAPNHKLTQPWRFWLAGEDTQRQLAHIYADNRALKNSQTLTKTLLDKKEMAYDRFYQKAFDKFMDIPAVVLVGQNLSDNEVVCKEDYAACSCAIQNFQLMAWSLKIGVQWSTGPIILDTRSYDVLGIKKSNIELIGALYLGHIDDDCLPNKTLKRKLVDEVTCYLS